MAQPGTGVLPFRPESSREEVQRCLDALVGVAQTAGVICETRVHHGPPARTILAAATSESADLVVLGAGITDNFERVLFGSTGEEVLRKAHCPVLTVGPKVLASAWSAHRDGPVVFATDFQARTAKAVVQAATLCKAIGTTLHCLHVLPRLLEFDPDIHLIPHIMTEALQHVVSGSGAAGDSPVCAITYGREISNAVVEYARQKGATMIVLGIREAPSTSTHLPAQITCRTIARASCPVLTVSFPMQAHGILASPCV